MSAYRRTRKSRGYRLLFAIIVVLISLVVIFVYNVFVHMDEISRIESERFAVKLINSAVSEAVPDELLQEMISSSANEKGDVRSLSLDHAKASRINTLISEAVTRKLEECENEGLSIPIGTLSGISFLNGKGFGLSLDLSCIGSVFTDITSEFVSCGINQSKYRVYVKISVKLNAILPISSTEVSVDYNYLLGERIIVGDVPQAYFSA